MKVKQLFTLGALAIASAAVFAQDVGGAPLSRDDVRRQVLEARAAGTLRHAGDEGPEERTAYKAQTEGTSAFTREAGRSAVLQARAAHQLAHAGAVAPEEEVLYARAHPWTPSLTRAEAREQVIEARANGELIPAGEGAYPEVRPPFRNPAYAWRDHFGRRSAASSQ
jgi:hypothetical protein